MARLLRSALPHSVLIYQDDFYKPDAEIPISKSTGLEDWDCPESFDLAYMQKVIQAVRETGTLPSTFDSKEETNTLGKTNVTDEQLHQVKQKLVSSKSTENTLYVIIDGIMLYHDPQFLIPYLDLAIFLRAPYETLKTRREARNGYVTLEGFWKDPPGYFDDMVWPGYVKAHSYLFENISCTGTEKDSTETIKMAIERLDNSPLTKTAEEFYKIKTPENNNWPMCQILNWAIELIQQLD